MRDDFDHDDDLRGAADADLLALGLGGTNMMAMLWAVAMGRRAVGVEMRGDPFLGVHWNIRVDLYHQLGLIDRMMLERYGEGGVPAPRRTASASASPTASTARTPSPATSCPTRSSTATTRSSTSSAPIHHVEFIDDRWRHGLPNRVVTLLQPPAGAARADPEKIRTDMVEVLDGPSTFQAGAAAILTLLRRYLETIEAMDLAMPERDSARAALHAPPRHPRARRASCAAPTGGRKHHHRGAAGARLQGQVPSHPRARHEADRPRRA